jgi:hypothetical protein
MSIVSDFVKCLNAAQKKNWVTLIAHIRKGEYIYNHDNYEIDKAYNSSRCALSFAYTYDILHGADDSSFNQTIEESSEAIDEFFGEDAVAIVFEGGSTFGEYLNEHTNEGEGADLDGEHAAKLLSDFLGFGAEHGDAKFVTIHWKSNQTDNFESVEALQSFLDLNPKRAQGYRKITVTKLVPRTVYDEVVETITL